MTWITDNTGTRWVDTQLPKRRKSPRALRFANLKVGDQIMKCHTAKGWRGGVDDFKGPPVELSQSTAYYLVTDLWFDPVAGQSNPIAGSMVAIKRIKPDGEPHDRKEGHTLRGLASQGFNYADRDFIEFCKARTEAANVVGIGHGKIIRQRPKVPGFPSL